MGAIAQNRFVAVRSFVTIVLEDGVGWTFDDIMEEAFAAGVSLGSSHLQRTLNALVREGEATKKKHTSTTKATYTLTDKGLVRAKYLVGLADKFYTWFSESAYSG